MKLAVVLLSLAAIAGAQDANSSKFKKLGSITWDPQTEKLVWVVQTGNMVDGKFASGGEERYQITPGDAVMAFSDEKRGFTQEEATSLRHLLDVLTVYCAESVEWWDDGQGVPLKPDGTPARPQTHPTREKTDPGPTKVSSPGTQPPAARPTPVGRVKLAGLVADAH